MKNFIKIILLFFPFLSVLAQNFNKEVAAEIIVKGPKEGIVFITASGKNLTNTNYSLTYEFSIIVKDAQQHIDKSTDEGRFTLEPYENKLLAETQIQKNDSLETIVLLLIYNEGKPISTKRVVLSFEEEKQVESFNKKNEGIILEGIVEEDTKTKAGKDFYGFFYQKYNMNDIKTNKIIKIEEAISFGRSTRILVKVGDVIIYQFFAQPKLDFLKAHADQAMIYLNGYLQKLEQASVGPTRY
ncbi:hypothetical protein JM658_08950 [Joostella atrarenae]|uniref:Curli production assembly/transport component CsgE n=1 Tax=Joostella atrarenae TaxID=679257 RepID=A0ABS9J3E7_9FLAO|nr:CsgE family curli-type amyloid fiber assembly protein [Joostella atrarenae]MCF8714953.1 hypothetical protein [Joostella atrarenae]